MKQILILLFMCLPVVVCGQKHRKASKKANEQTAEWRYEIEPVTTGAQGTVVVKVWSFSKYTSVAAGQSKKNAVHGVIFKGIPTKDRVQGKRALVSAAESGEHSDFFDAFFADGGDYQRFVTLTTQGTADEVLKTDKREYKVGTTVTVQYNDLRTFLEEQGIIKKLGGGF